MEEAGDSQQGQGTELGSKLVTIELKRFYVDLKKNERGVFVKIAEVDASGSKSKVILPLVGIEQFKSRLTLMHQASTELDSAGVEPPSSEVHMDPLRTEMMRCEDKKFFFDLCANVRGRFLKISQVRGGGYRHSTEPQCSSALNFVDMRPAEGSRLVALHLVDVENLSWTLRVYCAQPGAC